jgi:hypothetical protein
VIGLTVFAIIGEDVESNAFGCVILVIVSIIVSILSFGLRVFHTITVIETRQEGLQVEYLVRPAQLIPWPEISEASVGPLRRRVWAWPQFGAIIGLGWGNTLGHVRYGPAPGQWVIFPVFYWGRWGNKRVDELLRAIAMAADLPHVDNIYWGIGKYPIYRRHLQPPSQSPARISQRHPLDDYLTSRPGTEGERDSGSFDS